MTQTALTWTIEDALLAALLLPWMDHWHEVTELQQLQPSHFAWHRNWWIFSTMRQMQRDDEAINRPSVLFRMQKENPKNYDDLKVRDYVLGLLEEFRGEPLTSPFVRQWTQDLMNLRSAP